MWVPEVTARRTVRSGRSPYTSRLRAVAAHSSVSRSTTARSGCRATIAPLSAPTLVPRTRSGTMPRSRSARSMPTSTAPRTPPPPSTKAVLGPEGQERDRAADQRHEGEGQVPAGPAREQERAEQEDHVEPAVRDAQVGRDQLAELVDVGAAGHPGGSAVEDAPHG